MLQNNIKSKRIFGYKDGIFETGLYLSGIEDVGNFVRGMGDEVMEDVAYFLTSEEI